MPSDANNLKFIYRTPSSQFLTLALAFGAFAILAARSAAKAQGSAVVLYALALCLCVAGCAWSVMRLRRIREDPESVELNPEVALLPRASLGGGFFRLRYGDIRSINEQVIGGRRLLLVQASGVKACLFADGFASEGRFLEFANALMARWKGLEQARVPPPLAAPRISEGPDAATEAIKREIEVRKAADPLIGAKFAGKEIFARLMSALASKDPRGVHSETLLCALGALAGYACQASVRAQTIAMRSAPDSQFKVATTADGKRYFFGDALNFTLAEDRLSVWSVAAGAAQQAGAKKLPDLEEIFKHTAASVGSPSFGIPRYPGKGAAGDLPINYLKALWPVLLPIVSELTSDPRLWPLAYGIAIQQAIASTKEVLGPEVALTIAMEAAVPMSKVAL
jgi:hypothetical protein